MNKSANNEKQSLTSRRAFIKQASIGLAGFMILPRHVLGGRGFVAPSDRLYIAGIGVGGMGFQDLKRISEDKRVVVAHLCDVDERRSKDARSLFEGAAFHKDWRRMMDTVSSDIDAVTISTPDHNHAVPALRAMQGGKHVYVQKPLTKDIYEARVLTEAAQKYNVVTQMGNQGASGDGVRRLQEWYDAGVIGEVDTVYCWTDRPVWPQGQAWPSGKFEVPKALDWDLWLGTAPYKDYVDGLVPFNWRGWWDYGTGALGDMGCHLIEAPFTVLGLDRVDRVEASVGSVYVDEFKRGYHPEAFPPSSHVTMRVSRKGDSDKPVTVHWMDGGIRPSRPEELLPSETFGDGGNGVLFEGSKGKMMCGTYGERPQLLPTSKVDNTPETMARVKDGAQGHYLQWVEACMAGEADYLSASFDKAGPLTELLLIANLAIKGHDVRLSQQNGKGYVYPARDITLEWSHSDMKVTNLDEVNAFVKRTYREGFELII